MATSSPFNFPSSQWSIEYRSALRETNTARRHAKVDEAFCTCIKAQRTMNKGDLRIEELFAIQIALRDLYVLRCVSSKYGVAEGSIGEATYA